MKPAWESGAGFSALAVAGVLALNYPLIALFDRDTLVFGIPLPFLHIFVVWALLIAGLAVLVEYRSRRHPSTRNLREHGDKARYAEPSETGELDGVAVPPSGLRRHTED